MTEKSLIFHQESRDKACGGKMGHPETEHIMTLKLPANMSSDFVAVMNEFKNAEDSSDS